MPFCLQRVCALLFASMLALAGASMAAEPRGHLFIIGGGKRPAEMMSRFVELAGGKGRARIAVLPMASAEPATVGPQQAAEFRALGAAESFSLNCTHEEAQRPETVRRLDGMGGVFFSGGDQSRLTSVLLGTPLLEKIRELHTRGAIVGGTSAGAAVMSAKMITGDESKNPDPKDSFVVIKKENVKLAEGFGFIRNAIVDQHFIRRKRHNRLISLVLENPQLPGIGIDEATAIIVGPGATFEVVGEGSVLVYDAVEARGIRTDGSGNLGAAGIRIHLLLAGDRFSLGKRRLLTGKN